LRKTLSEPASRRRTSRARRRLRLSYDSDIDFLWAVEFGEVVDGRLDDETDEPVPGFYIWRRSPRGRVIGFGVDDLYGRFEGGDSDHGSDADDSDHGFDANQVAGLDELRFDVPILGLRDVSPAEIVLAARPALSGFSTPDVVFCDEAIEKSGEGELEESTLFWLGCLLAGEMKAHFGLGYTLFDLGRHHEAYSHLRSYTEINPRNSWAWTWLGKAAEAIGENGEAERAYRKAIALEKIGSYGTDAAELLEALRRPKPRRHHRRRRRRPGSDAPKTGGG
jgi:hypothetical protein